LYDIPASLDLTRKSSSTSRKCIACAVGELWDNADGLQDVAFAGFGSIFFGIKDFSGVALSFFEGSELTSLLL
jgi:hypothetical protein